MVRPTAFSNCGHAFKAFAVTPPPQAFGSPSGRPSNSATLAPPFASNSAAKEPAGPAPTINRSNCFMLIYGEHHNRAPGTTQETDIRRLEGRFFLMSDTL